VAVVRILVLVLLVAAAICFALFAFTGQQKYKRVGIAIFKWTLVATLVFFLVLAVDRFF
jgi:hypothetical protein